PGERRYGDAGARPDVGGREAQVRLGERSLDGLEEGLVPGLDRRRFRLGGPLARHLVERHLVAVGLHPHEIEQRCGRRPRAHRGELALHRFHRLVHPLPGVLDVVCQTGDGGHVTMVPTRSPASTLAVAPGWLMLNTTIGSLFSLHKPNAFASITA